MSKCGQCLKTKSGVAVTFGLSTCFTLFARLIIAVEKVVQLLAERVALGRLGHSTIVKRLVLTQRARHTATPTVRTGFR